MKGQERLDNCIKKGLLRIGLGAQRFLYCKHGVLNGGIWEGRVHEVLRDAGDDGRMYVRLDDSGEWELPENIFVEVILPAASATSAPVGPPTQTLSSGAAEGDVPIHPHRTKPTKTKPSKET